MSKEHPDHHDAELAFRAYELRRESVMRDSRNAINRDFWPKSFADVQAVTKADHPLNAAWRQTTTYWEMVYGTIKHGIVNADYFMESSGEGMFLFARVAPYLEELRREVSPLAFHNAEWVAKNTEVGRRRRLGGGARARRSEGDDKSEKRAETPPESAHESSPGAGGYRGGPAGSARPDDLSVLYFAASIFWTRAPYAANSFRPTSVFFATHSAFWNAKGDTSRRSSSR